MFWSKRSIILCESEERIACDLMKVLHCRHRVFRETKITVAISRLRDEIRNKEHLVLRVADSSCEGRPFLVDACPRIVTPAYVKPRPRLPLPSLRRSSPFASLFSDTFLHVRRRKLCRRHVPRHGLNLSERSTKGNHKSVRARWERGLNVLHVKYICHDQTAEIGIFVFLSWLPILLLFFRVFIFEIIHANYILIKI